MLYRILLRTFYFVYQKALQSFRLSPAADPLRNFDFHISDKYTVAYPYPHIPPFLYLQHTTFVSCLQANTEKQSAVLQMPKK